MKGRSYFLPISLVALVLVLSLVAILAPDAGAQDSGITTDDPANQARYDVPAQQDLETTGFSSGALNGFSNKYCCITIVTSAIAVPVLEINPSTAGSPAELIPVPNTVDFHRWICFGYQPGY
jgi:hypothetical protein